MTENISQPDSDYIPDENIESPPGRNVTVRTRRQDLNAPKQEESSYLCFDNQLSDNEVSKNYEKDIKSVYASKWMKSIKEKLDSYQHNNTSTLVDKTPYIRVIGCNWLFRLKEEPSDPRFKSRLCAKENSQIKVLTIKKHLV